MSGGPQQWLPLLFEGPWGPAGYPTCPGYSVADPLTNRPHNISQAKSTQLQGYGNAPAALFLRAMRCEACLLDGRSPGATLVDQALGTNARGAKSPHGETLGRSVLHFSPRDETLGRSVSHFCPRGETLGRSVSHFRTRVKTLSTFSTSVSTPRKHCLGTQNHSFKVG